MGGGQECHPNEGFGTVTWFNVRNGCGFIHRNDIKEDAFAHQTDIKKSNPRKYLPSVGDGDTVEFDDEGEAEAETANVTGPGGTAVQGSKYARAVTMTDAVRHGGPARDYQQNYQKSESGGKKEAPESAPSPRPGPFPTFLPAETLWPSITAFQPPEQGEVMERADNQGAGKR